MKWRQLLLSIIAFLICSVVNAFYSWESETSQGDVRGLLRGIGVASHPSDASLRLQDEQELAVIGRLIGQAQSASMAFELNIYQTYLPQSLLSQQGGFDSVLDVERSATLEWEISGDRYAHLVIDRLSARWSLPNVDITLGRQAANLATTFFFSPNDLFAPFAAQSFYRVYKPGVDALRTEVQLGELTQLSLIGVLGYRIDPTSITGWSDEVDSKRHSYLTRFTTNFAGLEWGLLAGKVRRTRIQGGSIQGELFGWLGIRAEGHVAEPLDGGRSEHAEFSLGIEHRWENSLFIQLEQFYHGQGETRVTAYDWLNNESGYLARRYHALGASYEFSPLLTGQMSIIRNYIDHSLLLSGNILYSLSDESELSASLTLPNGKQAQSFILQSEYGSYPTILNLELRSYF